MQGVPKTEQQEIHPWEQQTAERRKATLVRKRMESLTLNTNTQE